MGEYTKRRALRTVAETPGKPVDSNDNAAAEGGNVYGGDTRETAGGVGEAGGERAEPPWREGRRREGFDERGATDARGNAW